MSEVQASDSPATRPMSGSKAVESLDRFFDRAGDWCNPILIKEARQALKSRQFVWTFGVLLVGAWVWSVAGTMMMMPGIYYAPAGRAMLLGYYWVLAVPMMMVAPMAAHRSLVAEREDGTFEVLSISTLTSYQIIFGKLTSTVLQLIIYFTALVPCVAFTYILRGVDFPSIALIIATTFLTAIFLVVVGIFMATIATNRSLQSLMMVLLLLLILLAEYLHGLFVSDLLRTGMRSEDQSLVVMTILALFTFYLAGSMFLLVASASCISAASENKSTRLRFMMLLLQVLGLFWATYLVWYMTEFDVDYSRSFLRGVLRGPQVVLLLIIFVGAFFWTIMGGFMLGEPESMSPRVRRGLPRSFFGRVFLTWLNPGPGTGMVFAITSFIGLTIYVLTMEQYFGPILWLRTGNCARLAITIIGYMMLFLGFAHLLVGAVRTKGNVTPFVALVAMMLLMSLGCIIPYSAGLYYNNFRQFDWDSSQLTNWAWTLAEFTRGAEAPEVPWLVLGLGLFSVALNALYVGRDVMVQRISTPERVLEELASLRPPVESDESIDPLAR